MKGAMIKAASHKLSFFMYRYGVKMIWCIEAGEDVAEISLHHNALLRGRGRLNRPHSDDHSGIFSPLWTKYYFCSIFTTQSIKKKKKNKQKGPTH